MIPWAVALLLVALAWLALWFLRLGPAWSDAAPWDDTTAALPGGVSLIIPARNEARRLPTLLAGLAGEGPPELEILVVDDDSTDGTASAVLGARARDGRVRLVSCPPRPAGWAGKTWALDRGVAAASGQWLVFCDADLEPESGFLGCAFGLIRREKLDALSLLPRMSNRRRAPSILLACFVVSRALLFRPAAPGRRGLVQGAFLAVRRAAYEAVGGFDRLKGSLLEDVELGLLLQGAGFRVHTRPARRLLRTVTYETWTATREGLKKHLFAALDWSLARLTGVVILHGLLFVFPLVSLMAALPAAGNLDGAAVLTASCLALAAMYAVNLPLVRAEGLPLAAGLALPLAFLAFGELLAESAWGYRRGTIVWKGRSYPAAGRGKVPVP